jgi:alpha-glucoside transport system substrate-binding protein
MVLTAAGCGLAAPGQAEGEEKVTILGPWTDRQEGQFRKLLDTFGIPYDYQGTAAQREVLLSKVQAGEPPDIAILPGVGDLAEYADQGRLKPLDGLFEESEYGSPWQPSRDGAGSVYWVPLKADLKSIVWYKKGNEPPKSPAPLEKWCIGMGDDGTSGWPGSDWIEDILLQRSGPKTYERWARGDLEWTSDPVKGAWRAWGELLAQDSGAAKLALITDHRGTGGSDGLLFGSTGCTLEHQGSFARAFYGENKAKKAVFMDSAELLPGENYSVRAHEVTGDFAALFSESDQAEAVLKELASQSGQQAWVDEAGVFSANDKVRPKNDKADPKGGVVDKIAERLTSERKPRCLDASDVMPPAVRDAFYEAVLLTLARYSEDGGKGAQSINGILDDVQKVQKAQSKNLVARVEVCS